MQRSRKGGHSRLAGARLFARSSLIKTVRHPARPWKRRILSLMNVPPSRRREAQLPGSLNHHFVGVGRRCRSRRRSHRFSPRLRATLRSGIINVIGALRVVLRSDQQTLNTVAVDALARPSINQRGGTIPIYERSRGARSRARHFRVRYGGHVSVYAALIADMYNARSLPRAVMWRREKQAVRKIEKIANAEIWLVQGCPRARAVGTYRDETSANR